MADDLRSRRPPPPGPAGRVLIIDDSPPTREVLAALLRSAGHEVVVAPTGELGLQFARRHRPDVVLLDVYLPDVDGFTVLRRLREEGRARVIVLSTADDEQTRLRAEAAGADRFLIKGIAARDLQAAVGDSVVLARRARIRSV